MNLSLHRRLDELYASYNVEHSANDPVWTVRRFSRPEDQEIVAFCASALAFGRVQSVLASIDGLLAVLGDAPGQYVRQFTPARERARFDHLVHRWTRGVDLAALLWLLRQMLDSHGSIEQFFAADLPADAIDIGDALDAFSRRACALDTREVYGETVRSPGVAYFFARPSAGGACKRLNLFLRWMVRRDRIDLGLWTRVRPAQLVVPLDTHVIRISRCLRLTRYQSPGWRMAADITRSLRRIDPVDPVRFDFALCHLGMMGACGYGTSRKDVDCPLRGVCKPRGRRRR